MKMSGKRKMEIVEKECRECNICKKFKRKPRRPIVGLNLAENFNEVLAIDLGELEGEKFIVMVDWATRYSQAAWIKSKKPEEMIEKVMEKWVSYFGPPGKILSDGGREFQNEEFAEFAEKQGIELMVTASESPWSNGKCEKVVGLLKEGMRKMREDGIGRRELILPWIVSARNGLEMKGGFTPNQKVFGRNINKEKGLEEYTPSQLEEEIEGDKLRELMIIQEKVRENYLNNESREKIKRALKGKIREHKIEEAIVGDKIFYKKEGEDKWRGPGKVIGTDGKTVMVKQGALLRNVSKVHITKINKESLKEEEEESQEEKEENEEKTRKVERKIIVGEKWKIRKDDKEEWREIEILGRAGKAGGKWKDAYNILEIESGENYWINVKDYEMRKSRQENEEDGSPILDGENIYYSGTVESYNSRVKIAKEKELESWKSNEVYQEVEKEKEMKIIKTRWIISEKEKSDGIICKARLVAKGFMERENE